MNAQNAAPKKVRGRPKGSGKNDSQALAKVADMLLASPKMTASAAMRKGCPTIDGTLLRRLQRKWATEKTALKVAANDRLQERRKREEAARQSNRYPVPLVPDHGHIAHLLGIGKNFPAMLAYELATKNSMAATLIDLPNVSAMIANPPWIPRIAALAPQTNGALSEMLAATSHIGAMLASPPWMTGIAALAPQTGSAISKMLESMSQATHAQAFGCASNLASVLDPMGVRRRS